MISVMKIVNWFRVRNFLDKQQNPFIDTITQMKVMKLLYYVQGVTLALYNKKAFINPILAWKYGPVVKVVHERYRGKIHLPNIKKNNKQSFKDYDDIQKDSELSNVINAVNNAYGKMSAYELMEQTHKETPWKITPQSSEIDPKIIKHYFKKYIVR